MPFRQSLYVHIKYYRVSWNSSVNTTLQDAHTVHSFPLPGSGIVLTFILDILKLYTIRPEDDNPLLYHRIVEAFKWGYGYRSHLGDPSDPVYHDNITQVKLLYDTRYRIVLSKFVP